MLHRYAFSNFQSFKEHTVVSLQQDARVPATGWSRTAASGERLSTVMAVVGANASGKTSLLKPLLFMQWFISQSFALGHDAELPFVQHRDASDTPSEFEADVDFEGQLWRYALRTTRKQVLHESLYVKRERMNYVFVRDWNAATQSYDIKQKDFGFTPSEARKVRPNASLIATAAQYGVPLAQRIAAVDIQSNLSQFGRVPLNVDLVIGAAGYFAVDEAQRKQMIKLLAGWDMGLHDVLLREVESVKPDGSKAKHWFPFGMHKSRSDTPFALPFIDESSGTQSAFVLLARLLPALQSGGLAVIDEFENDLHPHMLEPILDLFANPATNPHNAQLLFTCHAIEVLNVLHKSQVTLVEKDECNESSAWRLDSVQGIRSDDNFYAKYMAGAYGAVPQL